MKIETKTTENTKDTKNSNICSYIRSLKPMLATKSRNPHMTGTQKNKEKSRNRLSALRRNKKSNKA